MPFPIGTTYCFREGRVKPVVLKSHAIKVYMERDGMTEEDAIEFWEYNMAGSDSYLIAVDDLVTQTELAEILAEQEGEEIDLDEPFTEEHYHTAKIQGIELE